jgi:hypothetical protein
MTAVAIEAIRNAQLGRLIRLGFPGLPALRLNPMEAGILARAIRAVVEGRSAETEIFMSPIFSDHDLVLRRGENGFAVEIDGGDGQLGFEDGAGIAARLAELAAETG